MCHREQILIATDVVTKLADELSVTPQEVTAVVTVLHLLSQLLDGMPAPN
jgi:hypothetical protein